MDVRISRWSSSARTPSTEPMSVGTITMVRADAGTPSRRSSRSSGTGEVIRWTTRFASDTANSLAGISTSAAAAVHIQCGAPADRAATTAPATPRPVRSASVPK